jgi:hypothetical protein
MATIPEPPTGPPDPVQLRDALRAMLAKPDETRAFHRRSRLSRERLETNAAMDWRWNLRDWPKPQRENRG